MASRSILRPAAAAAFLSAVGATQEPSAQQVPVPVVTSTPSPTPPLTLATPALTPRPGIDDLPTPVFVPNPRPTPTPLSPRPAPTVSPGAASDVVRAPTTAPTPAATSVLPPPIETVILPQQQPAPLWPWALGGAALLLVMLGLLGLRRPRDNEDDEIYESEWSPDVAAEPMLPVMPSGARLAVTLRPVRAGLNLISATADCEVTIVNVGAGRAEDVSTSLRLMSAREGQEAELSAFYTYPGERPAASPFALAPGEERRFRAVSALPHDAIHAIEAGGRPMFVPLLAVSVRYHDGNGPHRLGQAFVLGLDHGSAKLGPLWLDGPTRTYDNVAARLHGETDEG